MNEIASLWHSRSERKWKRALNRYWEGAPEDFKLERTMNKPQLDRIGGLDPRGWYDYLHDEYFRWKYTAPNRYATTTAHLRWYDESDQLEKLFRIKKRLLDLDVSDIRTGLLVAEEIRGLGIAGASGLLSLMYPHAFGTVDQFVVKALREIPDLPERRDLMRMNPECLNLSNGVVLISLMRRKAEENNHVFGAKHWTPRKIDMVLWAARPARASRCDR